MRFYVATRLENYEEQRELARRLISAGHRQTYDWTVGLENVFAGTFADLWQLKSEHQMHTTGLAELQGVTSADLVVAILPGGRGTHVELGIALGSGATVVLVTPPGFEMAVPFYRAADFLVTQEGDWMGRVVEAIEEA
jgi:hypothetical protein